MKTSLARMLYAAIFVVATGASPYASATASTNYADLWGKYSEPGWGLNISQQADILFATLFVYDKGEQAVWYSVTLNYQSTGANGAVTYSGDLYETTGPAIGKPYNPARVKYCQVGLATITCGDDAHAFFQYTADGAGEAKQIERLTFAANSLAGSYIGGTTDITFNCVNHNRNNLLTTDAGELTITQSDDNVIIKAPTCTYTGKYVQQGQVGRVDAVYECTNGAVGEIVFTAMDPEKGGIVGNYTGHDNACEFRGNIGGMRRLK